MLVDQNTIVLLLPEIILLVIAAWIYVGGTLTRSRLWWSLFALATYASAGIVMFREEFAIKELIESGQLLGPLIIDRLGHSFRALALGVGALLTLVAMRSASQRLASEYLATLMLLVVGLMLVARANELVLLFVALELITIPTFVLLFLGRAERATAEATVKYFYLSIFSSALLLYGFSFVYGIAGTTLITGGGGLTCIRDALLSGTDAPGLGALAPLALVLVFGGLAFKIAAVPFQFYAPDVYQGTSNANAGLLAVAPKIAGILVLVRLVVVAMPWVASFAWQIVMVVAILTMTIGNLAALWQTNVRRLLAYSSIAHAGYMLIGLAVALSPKPVASAYAGVAATLLYLVVYVLASLGAFAALAHLSDERRELDELDQLSGLGMQQPGVAAALAIFMFSLAGIPPLAGFWGKLTLFAGAVELAASQEGVAPWFVVLAVIGVMNAAVAAAYYLRVVGTLYFGVPHEPATTGQGGWGSLSCAGICAVAVVLLGIMPGRAVETAAELAQGLATRPAVSADLSLRADESR